MAEAGHPQDLPSAWLAAALENVADHVALLASDGALRYVTPSLRALAADPAAPDDPLGALREDLSRAIRDGRQEGEMSDLGIANALGRWRFCLTSVAGPPPGILAAIRPVGAEAEGWDPTGEAMAQRAVALAQANRELEALNNVAMAVNQSLELSTVLGIVLETALAAAEIETGWVRLLTAEGGEDLEMVAQRGLSPACAAALSRVPLRNSFAGKAVLTGKPLVLYSMPLDSPTCRYLATYEGIKCLANIPLRSKGTVIGVLSIGARRVPQISERLVHFLTAIGNQVGMAIENARLYEQVQRRARLDPLTQLYNRQRFHELLERELLERPHEPPLVLMVDLNHFKELNDTFGHAQGDQALQRVARRLRESVTPKDIVGRYGGDEFVIALLDPAYRAHSSALPNLMRSLQMPLEQWDGNRRIALSLSIGLATRGSTVEEMLQQADQAMYVEKRRHHAMSRAPVARA